MDSSMIDCEDTHFGDLIFNCINSIDLFSCSKLERCYECTFCDECFQSSYCENCNGLSDCYLCFDCKSSDFLVGCTGIRQGKNKILNQDAEKAEILDTIRKLNTDPNFRIDFESKYQELKLQHPRRASWMINAENCSGTFIWNSKNLYHGFNMRNSEDSRYCYEGNADVSVCDITRNGNCEMLYECANMIDTSYSAFCNLAYQSSEVLYCDNCIGTENSFGCVSLKKQKYCILNTQYSKEEYEDLVPKIIEHMQANGEYGEFFPIEISPFGYNETKSIEWYSMTKSEVIAKGWKWSDYESPITNITKTINANQIPSSIEDIPDEILEWAIICKKSGKPFKIIRQELNFYRSLGLPIPHLCPKERHFARIAPTNVRKLYSRQCAKCSKDIQTTYAPDRPEIVYCEECYLSEVY